MLNIKKSLILLVLVLIINDKAIAHSGGTDSNGCHAGTEPYHCHNDKSSGGGSLAIAGGALLVGGLLWLILNDDNMQSKNIQSKAFIKQTEGSIQYGNYLLYSLSQNSGIHFLMGTEVKHDLYTNSGLYNKNTQAYIGLSFTPTEGMNVNLKGNSKNFGLNFNLSF